MNQKILEKNLNAIRSWSQEWANFIDNEEYELQDDVQVIARKSKQGDVIFSVKKDDKERYLNGKYNPIEEAEHWCETIIERKTKICFLMGIGDGIYLRKLVEKVDDDAVIIIYEPSINIFIKLIQEVDISHLLGNKNIGLVIKGINEEEFENIVNSVLVVENYTLIYTAILPNYEMLFEKEITKAIEIIKKRVNQITVAWNTGRYFANVNETNVIRNIKWLSSEYTMTRLDGICPPEVPCIVVAAGPSLNKNISQLKNAKGKACILACDTALKPLLKEGIVPDFFLIVDPRKPEVLFEFDKIKDIPMVVPFNIPEKIMKKHTGKKFLYWDGDSFIYNAFVAAKDLEHKSIPYEEGLGILPTGGSVATSAFALARILGTRTIILVGQDLAYTDDKTHADGTFQEKMEKLDMSQDDYIEVDGINGSKVKTIYNLKMYLEWFENQIKQMPEYNVIDATEGGALIHGTKVQTLKDAIEQNCKNGWDSESILEKMPKCLDEEDVERLKEFLNGVAKSADKTLPKIQEGIRLYEKLLKISQRKIQEKQLQKLLKKIKKVNTYLDQDEVALMAAGCLQEIEYSIRTGMYSYEATTEAEMRKVAEEGISYLKWQEEMVKLLVPILEEEFLQEA